MNNVIDFLKQLAIFSWGSIEKSRFNVLKNSVRFRCPYCRDSKKNKNKKRFNYNLKKNIFHCFNCGKSGNLNNLIDHFKLEEFNDLRSQLNRLKINDFINKKEENDESEYELFYPNGCLLNEVVKNDNYKNLRDDDKKLLIKVLYFLNSRKIKKEWYNYFYFVFSGEKYQNYLLTLFLYNDDWIWSGRKISDEFIGPKYIHLPNFPFIKTISFENEISLLKGNNLYICESFFSSLVLNQDGFNSVSVFGINNMKFDHQPLDKYRKDFNLIWIPDNDDSLTMFLKSNYDFRKKMKILVPPDKDICDTYIRLNGNFKKEFIEMKEIMLFDYGILDKINKFI